VEACAIVGLPHPVLGERICAAVRAKDGVGSELIAELTALCRRDLAAFKVPEIWRVVDDLPRTPTGKVQKALIREEFVKSADQR
jgi:acyl-CoA synthetase (AMP-forming)/AMP-acid ligase II